MRPTRHVYAVEGWGHGEVWTRGTTLLQHELASPALSPPDAAGARRGGGPRGRGASGTETPSGGAEAPSGTVAGRRARNGDATVAALCRRFARHLAGRRVAYDDVELDLEWMTPFQRELAEALRGVPWGEVVAYGELAGLAGRPRAARAAGSFCAENRFALVLPCHRVVASDGIGGYGSSGVALKRRLLALEGVEL